MTPIVSRLDLRPRRALALAVAALCGCAAAPAAFAAPIPVTNCNDSGTGSLRAAVAAAASGDTIQASGLAGVCSKITLKTGDIAVGVNNLTIVGPGVKQLDVSALYDNGAGLTHQYRNRIFTHSGTGTLTLKNLHVSDGYVDENIGARGGCIRSSGTVAIDHAEVSGCTATTMDAYAQGGGIYALNVTVSYGTLRNNRVDGGASGASNGGAVLAANDFTAAYSTIANNTATNTAGTGGMAGGVRTLGPYVLIKNSTLTGNTAGDSRGAISAENADGTLIVSNSTVSGNSALNGNTGGIYSSAFHTKVYNSTVAFNSAKTDAYGVGWHMLGGIGGAAIIESSIIAENTFGAGAVDDDLSIRFVTLSGHNNLIFASRAALPGDTIVGACPLLGPLRVNGGVTATHRLPMRSPAIDAGNNTFGAAFDQRGGTGANSVRDYVRVSGRPDTLLRADIGAYEVDQADEIFDAAFEGCP